MTDIKALQRSCSYSFPTNKKNYCGPKNAFSFFENFVKKPEKKQAKQVQTLIRGFPILFSYYDFIARENGLGPFDKKIINHYWHAEKLCEFKPKKAQEFVLESLTKVGLSVKRAEKITKRINSPVCLDHGFHVLCVNFVTGKVAKTVENFSNCLVLPARIIGELDGKILAKKTELAGMNGSFFEKEKVLENPFGLPVKKNSFVSVHWNNAIESITKRHAEKLKEKVFGQTQSN